MWKGSKWPEDQTERQSLHRLSDGGSGQNAKSLPDSSVSGSLRLNKKINVGPIRTVPRPATSDGQAYGEDYTSGPDSSGDEIPPVD
ncbi:hypothetical protein J6590_004975 [Homalodisca vitripennis]|nr:hypothetical protein J6590_004975 [Homalodisca vitripennis]